MRWSGVIVAAGASTRAGEGPRKPWRRLGGKPVARWSLEAMLAAGASQVVVVIAAGDEDEAASAFAGLVGWAATPGGAARAASVQAGLAVLTDEPAEAAVLVHDAARPFLTPGHIEALLAALAEADGALPALPVTDTLKRRDGAGGLATAARDGLERAQTPQAFRLAALRGAYAAWPADAGEPTDDAQVVERAGGRIALTAGDPMLMKLTYPEDFAMAERLAAAARVTCVGQGYD